MTNNNMYFIANWKMHGNTADINKSKSVIKLANLKKYKILKIIYCPPFTLLKTFFDKFKNSNVFIGAQNCHSVSGYGAYTGSINAKLIKLIEENIISTRIAKDVFEIMLENNQDPEEIVEREGLKQVSDSAELEKIIDNIIANNPDQVEAVKLKPKLIGWFVGQVMKETNGKANPKLVNDLLNDKLN